MIHGFMRRYPVDLTEAALPDPSAYPSFNAFFTRRLGDGTRPMPSRRDAIACPVDGTISQIGSIDGPRLIQAKGRMYTLGSLLGGRDDLAGRFDGGLFATLYLAPHNYHRIHMPVRAVLKEVLYVPGTLFSVNHRASRVVERLLARNERVINVFDIGTSYVALIMVGAMFVGSMELTACTLPAHRRGRPRKRPVSVPVDPPPRVLQRGEEMGRFNMGSTVIVLFERDAGRWHSGLGPGDPVRMGQPIGTLTADNPASR
jgi:phosphatidylserine decarboxylase